MTMRTIKIMKQHEFSIKSFEFIEPKNINVYKWYTTKRINYSRVLLHFQPLHPSVRRSHFVSQMLFEIENGVTYENLI